MKRIAVIVSLVATAAFAQPQPRDPRIDALAADLHALTRVATLSQDLGDSRQVMLALLDANVTSMRMPREDGTYRWASLQREEASRVTDEKTIELVSTEAQLRNVTVTAPNAYRVEVTVPQKRGVFSTNNRVFIRNVLVDLTSFDGRTSHHEIPVNAWVNPGDSNGVALPDIGKSVRATAELGVESGSKKAVAEVALVQAKLVDDPNSPYFPAIKRLLQIRELGAARDIDRGALKNATDEALLSLPGELEKRTAEQARAAELRRTAAPKGAIAVGDATPDVIDALAEVARLMSGTVVEQNEGRAKLQAVLDALRAPVQ